MLTRALESQFGPSSFNCPRSDLFKLVQTGSVHQYYMEFSALANRTYGVSADAMLDCFVAGLKPELRREVIAQNPLNYYDYKSKPATWSPRSYYRPKPPPNPSQSSSSPHPRPPPLLPLPQPKPPPLQPRNPSFRHMSQDEMQRRRENGLCFICDEK